MAKKKKGTVEGKLAKPKSEKSLAVVKSPQQKAADTRRRQKAEAEQLERANAQRLAQIVNLHIGGYSLADIALATKSSVAEIERLLAQDTARYVRTQPALRVYVRNYISEKYNKMLEANIEAATDKMNPQKLDNQDRAIRILKEMGRLHGAEAPTQTEVKVDAAPEMVERMVQALSRAEGLHYDVGVFDVVDAEVVHDSVEESEKALLDSAERVGEPQDGDEEGFGGDLDG